jgi:hypothetical protein
VKPVSLRVQLWLIAAGYAAVVAIAAILLLGRYLLEATHRADVSAAGGMYGFGDAILYLFVAGLFLIPTFFLLWVMARFEALYTRYAQAILVFSLSAPICLAVVYFDPKRLPQSLAFICLCRLVCSPLFLTGLIVSRLVARFAPAKKLTSYSLVIEALTLGLAVVLFLKSH